MSEVPHTGTLLRNVFHQLRVIYPGHIHEAVPSQPSERDLKGTGQKRKITDATSKKSTGESREEIAGREVSIKSVPSTRAGVRMQL